MRGSIRMAVGFLVVFGAVGGMETTGNDLMLIPLLALAAAGLGLMYSGVNAMNAVPAGLSR